MFPMEPFVTVPEKAVEAPVPMEPPLMVPEIFTTHAAPTVPEKELHVPAIFRVPVTVPEKLDKMPSLAMLSDPIVPELITAPEPDELRTTTDAAVLKATCGSPVPSPLRLAIPPIAPMAEME
jgi:hypothetical protein